MTIILAPAGELLEGEELAEFLDCEDGFNGLVPAILAALLGTLHLDIILALVVLELFDKVVRVVFHRVADLDKADEGRLDLEAAQFDGEEEEAVRNVFDTEALFDGLAQELDDVAAFEDAQLNAAVGGEHVVYVVAAEAVS